VDVSELDLTDRPKVKVALRGQGKAGLSGRGTPVASKRSFVSSLSKSNTTNLDLGKMRQAANTLKYGKNVLKTGKNEVFNNKQKQVPIARKRIELTKKTYT